MEPANRRNAIRDDRLDAIAEAFVFDRHQCAEEEILAPWRENTDEASAAQAIARCRLDEGYSQWWEEFVRDPSPRKRNGYGAADLAAAFARLRSDWRVRRLGRQSRPGRADCGG
ncbi:MAG: hypothetical protein NZ523_08780 [Elioraea sp.]|nr:hypothetical protein [Elioraea sp.]MDW8445545.1 hypothetical protein [Acetobacteraceae bacterium]